MTHSLADIPVLEPYLPRLKTLGYSTYEQLVSAAIAAGPELARYLGIQTLNSLFDQIDSPPQAIAEEVRERLDALPCALGVALDQVPYLVDAPALAEQVAPIHEVNLIPQLPPVRNQGVRGTCVAHAALAAYEHVLKTTGAY